MKDLTEYGTLAILLYFTLLYQVKKGKTLNIAWTFCKRCSCIVKVLKGVGKEDSVHIQRYKGLRDECGAIMGNHLTSNQNSKTVTIDNAAESDHIYFL
jgi:DNA gyrase subunit B